MLRLRYQEDDQEYIEDVERIVRVFHERGKDISRDLARAAWKSYSDSMAAGWLCLPVSDEALFDDCMTQLIDDEEVW